jgi:A/G-specific adenine glycosylase
MCQPDPSITERLLTWFADHGRRLPWRQARPHGAPRDPYRVWVAEIMLQQTQVATVIPYYRAFLERFPSTRALAEASQEDVLKAWEGMGYYARARNLHRAAQIVQSRHGGHVPGTREALLALPGVGEYTAGAILSLAFAQDTPALDANARRVLARLCAVEEPLDRPATLRRLKEAAEALMPAGQGGAFNEALMDLGALICTPSAPACAGCPLMTACQAQALGRVAAIPARRPRRVVPHYAVTAAVIWQEGRLLLTQRREDKMLGGMWEFPGGKCEDGESLEDCLRREIREELALEIEVGDALTTVRHAYTHLRITLHAFECRLLAGTPQAIGCQDWRWVRVHELSGFPLSVADQRIAEAVRRGAGRNGRGE